MSPIALDLPALHLQIWWHSLLLGLTVAAALLFLPSWLLWSEAIAPRRSRLAIFALALVALAGGRLHFVLNHLELGSSPLHLALLGGGALHAGGAMLALLLCSPWILRRCGIDVGRFLDGLSPFAGIGIATSRIGCFLHGCCFGAVCDLPWAVRYPLDSPAFEHQGRLGLLDPHATASLAVHPLPLYFAAAGLLVTAFALWYRPRRRFEGAVAALSLALFGASSAVLEMLREELPGRPSIAGVPQLACVAALLCVVGIALFAYGARRRARVQIAAFA